jgi:hypothetical protein
LIILSLLWIKPPLAPPTFNIQKFLYPIIVIAANISLGWVIIVPLGLDFVIGILIPLLIGIQFLLILSLKNIIEKRYWKQIYLLTPIIAGILSLFVFYSYNLIDPYLNVVIPILIGLVLIFPLVVDYNPFRFLTFNCKLLFVGVAGVMWLFTFLIFGYVPFVVEQTFLKGLIATVVFILVIYSILPKAYEFTEFTYLYLSIGLSAGLSIIIFMFVVADLLPKIILIAVLSAGGVCLGTYKIMAKKAEKKPELSIWRLMLLIGGFVAIIIFTILLFAFIVAI